MKHTPKNRPVLIRLIILGAAAGTLLWGLCEILAEAAGLPFSLSVGPVGFDLYVVSFFIRINPGTFLGLASGVLIFNRI